MEVFCNVVFCGYRYAVNDAIGGSVHSIPEHAKRYESIHSGFPCDVATGTCDTFSLNGSVMLHVCILKFIPDRHRYCRS
jgi:hypothetical protein